MPDLGIIGINSMLAPLRKQTGTHTRQPAGKGDRGGRNDVGARDRSVIYTRINSGRGAARVPPFSELV